jgi:hypothetical protein
MKTHRVASFLGFLLLGVPFTACDEAAPEDLESTTSESDGAPEDGTTDETTDETSTGDVAGLVGPVDDLIISPVDPQFLLPEPGYEETIAPPLSHSVKSIWGPWPKCQPKGEKTSTFLYEAPPGAVILSAYINVLSSNNGWHDDPGHQRRQLQVRQRAAGQPDLRRGDSSSPSNWGTSSSSRSSSRRGPRWSRTSPYILRQGRRPRGRRPCDDQGQLHDQSHQRLARPRHRPEAPLHRPAGRRDAGRSAQREVRARPRRPDAACAARAASRSLARLRRRRHRQVQRRAVRARRPPPVRLGLHSDCASLHCWKGNCGGVPQSDQCL